MKFGRKIKTDIYTEWKEYYLDYNRLKGVLKDGTLGNTWNTQKELAFTQLLEQELEKIHNFQRAKTAELASRIRNAETAIKELMADYDAGDEYEHPAHDLEAHPHGDDGGSEHGEDTDTDSEDGIEEKFRELEEEVATLVADVHDLALYTKLNFTGFIKIVKKHDKQTGLTLKNTFIKDFLDKRPFYKYNWDSIIVKLSRLYDLVRTRGHPVQGDSSAGGSQSAFVRQTTKYWVHPDNLVHLKLAILRHLPVLVFNPNKEFEPSDSAITSIYFDNEDLELYLGRIEKTEGAEAIRLRWYGGMDVKTIFVERKTHREDWTGEKSVKARFPIKEENVNAFLRGEYIMDQEFENLVRKGKKTQAEADAMIQLANEVQYAILTRKLKPVMRTFYNRTAFQLPGDARVRISLDTELTMVREDNWDDRERSGSNWRRPDIGIDWPFDQLLNEDVERFKYGVLEIKLQTQYGQEPPTWVRDLLNSHLVESIPKFSKFIHGCSTLIANRVDLVPFWLPQMDTDIRKPDTGAMHIDRPVHGSSSRDSYTPDDRSAQTRPTYTEPLSEGEEDEDMAIAVAKDEDKRARVPTSEAQQAIAFREEVRRREEAERAQKQPANGSRTVDENGAAGDHEDERTPFLRRKTSQAASIGKPKHLAIDPLSPSHAFDHSFKSKLIASKANGAASVDGTIPEETPPYDTAENTVELVREFVAEPGKRIAVPVRVEPKVFFAQERTFLKWLQFSVVLGAIATTLLNFGGTNDNISFICASAFTIAALLSIAYSTGVFVYRSIKLRKRDADGLYYDPYGPTALCLALLAAVGINCGLRLKEVL